MGEITAEGNEVFNTHLLSMEEVWWIREHPYNIVSVRARKLAAEISQIEDSLEDKRAALDLLAKQIDKKSKA